MSLILEALRKSEAERRRGSAPDVAMELPPAAVARKPGVPTWLLPALVTAAIAVPIALWWWQRGPATPATSAAATAAATPVPVAAPAVVPRPQPQVAAPPTIAASAPQALPPPSPPSPQPPRIAAPAAAPTPAPAPAASAGVPDIDASGMPPVRLSMHMWDPSPARRFVILDGQRMAEGERRGELTVVAIEREGVVIERNGQRARVPLP